MYCIIYRNVKFRSLITWTRKAVEVRPMIRFYVSPSDLPDILKPKSVDIHAKFDNLTHLYRFPHMGQASFISNLKIYFIPLLTLLTVCMPMLLEGGEVDEESARELVLIYAACLGQVALLSIPVLNFIGHIYINPKSEVVLSYLNYYGNRVDEKFPAGDLFVRSRETGLLKFFTRDSIYFFLVSRSTGRKFRINMKHGELFDEDIFNELFGEIPPNAAN